MHGASLGSGGAASCARIVIAAVPLQFLFLKYSGQGWHACCNRLAGLARLATACRGQNLHGAEGGDGGSKARPLACAGHGRQASVPLTRASLVVWSWPAAGQGTSSSRQDQMRAAHRRDGATAGRSPPLALELRALASSSSRSALESIQCYPRGHAQPGERGGGARQEGDGARSVRQLLFARKCGLQGLVSSELFPPAARGAQRLQHAVTKAQRRRRGAPLLPQRMHALLGSHCCRGIHFHCHCMPARPAGSTALRSAGSAASDGGAAAGCAAVLPSCERILHWWEQRPSRAAANGPSSTSYAVGATALANCWSAAQAGRTAGRAGRQPRHISSWAITSRSSPSPASPTVGFPQPSYRARTVGQDGAGARLALRLAQ